MNPSKIEWIRNPDGSKGFTFNPVTGCNGGCLYCYARPRAKMSQKSPNLKIAHKYRNGFKPTFHPEILDQPAKRKKPTRIFVVSMGDLFGRWVSDEWIEKVFKACAAAPQHTYFFLTKNRVRYRTGYLANIWSKKFNNKKVWWGWSETGLGDAEIKRELDGSLNEYVSLEPLLGSVCISADYPVDWIIVGAQTNPTKLPEKEWVLNIKRQCEDLNIPIFMKNNLAPLGIELAQQFPEGV